MASLHSSKLSTSTIAPRTLRLASQCRRVVVASLTLLWLLSLTGTAEARRFMERKTNYGRVKGLVETVYAGKRVEKYLGVPYASPPLGPLRFEAPQPPEPWSGVLRVTELPPACPQPKMGMMYINMHIPDFNRTSEDCLYLNIHSPKHGHHNKHKYPVIVFVHGGSYQNGMGAMMDGDVLATYDVIVVTFNYRLGALGFLSAPDTPLSGNYGMLDQLAVLKWVKANIGHFGGDPERITIDGHSAGGSSVGLLMLSPLSKGLFTGVIEQSGSPFAHWAVSRHEAGPSLYFRMFVTAMGCSGNHTASHIKRCMQELPSDFVQKVILDEPDNQISLIPPFRPVVDGHFLPELPEMLAAKGEVTGSHFLTGATRDEGLIAAQGLFGERFKMEGLEGTQKLMAQMNCFRGDLPQVHGIVESILEAYAKWPYNMNDDEIKDHFSEIIGDYFILAPTHKMASVMAALNLTVFVYNYEYMSELSNWGGVIHGAELFYLAGFPIKGNNNNYRYDDSDKHMARLLLQLWANFAKNGLPSLVPVQNFHMPRFTLSHRSYTRLFSSGRTPTLNVQHDLKPDKLAFWNMQVPRMFQRQLDEMKRYPPAGTVISRHTTFTGRGGENEGGEREITPHDSTELNTQLDGSDVGAGSGKAPPDEYMTRHGSNSWILIAACIGLSLLTVLLSVCYCQVRRQVNNLIRQSSVSSGQPIL